MAVAQAVAGRGAQQSSPPFRRTGRAAGALCRGGASAAPLAARAAVAGACRGVVRQAQVQLQQLLQWLLLLRGAATLAMPLPWRQQSLLQLLQLLHKQLLKRQAVAVVAAVAVRAPPPLTRAARCSPCLRAWLAALQPPLAWTFLPCWRVAALRA